MLLGKVLKSKRAISPILATLLLIVISVAAIVLTYAWIMTYMNSAGQQAGVIMYKENIRFYGTPADSDRNLIEIAVGNTGKTSTQILRIYMGNGSGSMLELTNYSDIGSGKPLSADTVARITINWPNTLAVKWEPGKTYYFRIVPSQGPYLEFQEQAPL